LCNGGGIKHKLFSWQPFTKQILINVHLDIKLNFFLTRFPLHLQNYLFWKAMVKTWTIFQGTNDMYISLAWLLMEKYQINNCKILCVWIWKIIISSLSLFAGSGKFLEFLNDIPQTCHRPSSLTFWKEWVFNNSYIYKACLECSQSRNYIAK